MGPESIVDSFAGRRIVVVGDVIADQFLNGTISRVSREAPVFILRHELTETRPGGAANAAANIAALGGRAVLIGVAGADESGEALRTELVNAGVDISQLITDGEVKTTTKVRVLAGQSYAARQQVIRIDYENSTAHSAPTRSALTERLGDAAAAADGIIVSDYGGGAVDAGLYADILSIAARRSIPVAVDSRHRLADLKGATTATPNQEEVEALLGKGASPDDCERLRCELGYRALLITNGNKGMTLFEEGQPPLSMDVVGAREPVDVTGAGDTVIAAYTLALSAGASHPDAAMIANHAGGLVVMKKGTATVTAAELVRSLCSNAPLTSQQAR